MKRLQFCVGGVATMGVLLAATACDPPPEPSDDITVTRIEVPGEDEVIRLPGSCLTGSSVMSADGEVVVWGDAGPEGVRPAYLWHEGEATRIGDEAFYVDNPVCVSDRGLVAGMQDLEHQLLGERTFLWADGEISTLPSSEGGLLVTGVNDRGQVAGRLYSASPGSPHPVVWENGELIMPPSAPWGTRGLTRGINNRGEVLVADVGATVEAGNFWLWDVDGDEVTEIEGIDQVEDMNHRGMVLGHGTDADGYERAYLWHNGQLTDLGTLGGDYVEAGALNEWGQVVGRSRDADGAMHSFLWYQGKMTQAESLEGTPLAINNWGQVVSGDPGSFGSPRKLFLWQNGRSINLGDLIESGSGAPSGPVDINDRGQILANTSSGPVVWTASPTWGYYPDGL